MNRDIIIPILFLAIAGGIYWYFDGQQREASLQPIKKSIIASQRPLVLHFYADWCGPCKAFEPVLRDTLRPYGGAIDCQDLNIDISKNRRLMYACGASAIPTTVVFDRRGNQVAKETGYIPAKELDQLLRKAVVYNSR